MSSNPMMAFAKGAKTALIWEGVLAILAGLFMIIWPKTAAGIIIGVIGALLVLDGILAFVAYLQTPKDLRSGWTLTRAIGAVLAGIVMFTLTNVVAVVMIYIIAFYVVLISIASIAGAFVVKKSGAPAWWILLVAGILGFVAALIMIFNPSAGIAGILWVVGLFLVLQGAAALFIGWRIKKATSDYIPPADGETIQGDIAS